QMELGALIHDETGATGAVSATLQATGLDLKEKQLSVGSAGTGAVLGNTLATVANVDHASFDLEVHKAQHQDRVRRELNVRRPLDTDLRVLGFSREHENSARLEFPKDAIGTLSEAQVTVDRAGLAVLAPFLVQVVDYPFGCTEQTVSALSAMLASPELTAAVLPERASKDALRKRVLEGQALLMRARTPDGTFALYPSMRGRPEITALVLDVALQMRTAGYEVPEAMRGGAIEALRGWVKAQALAKLQPTDRVLAAFSAELLARAGKPDEALETELWNLREQLDDEALAHLVLALATHDAHADRRTDLISRLAAERWLTVQRDVMLPWRSAEALSGIVLTALATARAPEAQQKHVADWLITRASDPNAWFSTRDTAETLTGLGAWAKRLHGGETRVSIGLDGKTWYSGTLHGAQVVSLRKLASEVTAGQLWIKADTDVVSAIRRKDVRESAPRNAFARGLSVKRRYLDPKTGTPLGEIKLGDLVQVVLELSTETGLPMVALTDPLPAGLEPLDPGLSTGTLAGCNTCDSASWGFDYVRRRDDRIDAFAERLTPGTHTIRYLLRATIAGTFSAPGAEVLPMYSPNLFGRSEVGRVQIKR
ncbi:MAG TPA: hypothetical protein VHM19_20400, partial [Polyangiales bacterium]|nr:hypothetical protein [Polyangiales bacterium]